MKIAFRLARQSRHPLAVMVSILLALALPISVLANVAVTQISSDPYTNIDSQHATQVEPDSFAYGNTIVTAVQTGRFYNGGASNICWSTSTNAGASWTNGCLPGLTNNAPPGGGTFDRVSDPVVAYDARHNVWMISTLPLIGRSSTVAPTAAGVYTSRSTDGGLTWGNPILVTGSNQQSPDKNWIVCDNTATSPFYGNCYTEWDANGDGNRIYMSTSTDGGLTWGARMRTANSATGIGGQPLVQPNGTVIVPIDSGNETALLAFNSTNGGTSWSATTTITTISTHTVAGGLRTGPLPSAEIDAAGKVYVVWQDCRFRRGCKVNDLVMTTSTNGTTWTPVVRIPIDSTGSNVDHFIPGLAVDGTTSGGTAKLALAYYYYPKANCGSSCQLTVGYISSVNGGGAWTAATQLAGPMSLTWIADTSQGRMVGDYISTSYSGGTAHPVFTLATAPSGSTFHEALFTPSAGLSSGAAVVTAGADQPVPGAASDHAAPQSPIVQR
ncbi:MAG TPA: sialidase family protein [Anaerolineales bacterium]|nr:sialidase family protein [Anaerolineales bacterium]